MRPTLARTSSAASGLRFCGMIEEPVENASGRLTKPKGWLAHRISSSARRERCSAHWAAAIIGYVLGGPSGAVVATVGIFLPAFFFVAVYTESLALFFSVLFVTLLRAGKGVGAFLAGVLLAGSEYRRALETDAFGELVRRGVGKARAGERGVER